MSLLLVAGAGASNDSRFAGADDAQDHDAKPPLAKELFSASYSGVLRPNRHLDGALLHMRRAVANREDIEEAMDRLQLDAEAGDQEREKQLLALRFWVHAVMGRVGSWAPSGLTNHFLLLDILRSKQAIAGLDDVMVVTFNWDLLMERAIESVYEHEIAGFEDYLSHDQIRLWKLHGSVDWSHPTSLVHAFPHPKHVYPLVIERPSEAIPLEDTFHFGGHYLVEWQQPQEGESPGRVALPALALPFKSKHWFECPSIHVDDLRLRLPGVDRVIVIGWAGGERGFLDMLKSVKPEVPTMVVGNTEEGVRRTVAALGQGGLRNIRATRAGFSEAVKTHAFARFVDGEPIT